MATIGSPADRPLGRDAFGVQPDHAPALRGRPAPAAGSVAPPQADTKVLGHMKSGVIYDWAAGGGPKQGPPGRSRASSFLALGLVAKAVEGDAEDVLDLAPVADRDLGDPDHHLHDVRKLDVLPRDARLLGAL